MKGSVLPMTNYGMEKLLALDIMRKALGSKVRGKDSSGLLNKRKHLVSMKKGISMDFTPSSRRVRSRIGLTLQALNMTTNRTFTAPKTRAVRTNMLILTLATHVQAKLEPKESKNNNKTKVSGGILETLIHGSGIKTIVKSSTQGKLVKIRMTRSKRTGRKACHKTNKRTTKSILKSLREPGVQLNSIVLSFNSSKTTDTI